ncbi:MAG: NAD-binding protein [Campylobacterota bacterium]|nr:NAD-binding protein [Campylobacterota bacterium]
MNNSSLWIILQRMRLPFTVIVIAYAISMTGLIIIPGIDDQGNIYHMSIFDAFYFVSYTATTIGFGEIPFPFTYAQKMWISASIYITVLGWFYGIGTLVSLLQDKLFLSEIARARFKRSVKHIKEDFVIILGYNDTTSEIIQKMLDSKVRVVVIEQEQQRADYLRLEGFVPNVPVLVADVYDPTSLEYAGIKSIHCKAIIALFEKNILNMRVTLASKILNPHIKVAVRSGTQDETGNLLDAGANIVENPFAIIAYQIQMSLNTPSLFKIENWLYKIDTLDTKTFSIPKESIIICGFGRLGKSLYKIFKENNITPTIIESDSRIVEDAFNHNIRNIILGNSEDKFYLEKANIKDAKLVLIATNNDTTNLSIASTVKKMNKKTIIISRENELSDFSIFSHAKIDHIFIPAKILIHKTTNAIINPLCDRMIRVLTHKDEQWGRKLLSILMKSIHTNPSTYELNINKTEAIEIFNYLSDKKKTLKLSKLQLSRRDRTQKNNLIPLLIVRDEEDIVLPQLDLNIKINDKILFACDENAKEDLEYIANNVYEFHYVVEGKEKTFLKWKK